MFVVLVEDDPYIAQSICSALDYLNISVEHVATARAADYFIRQSAVDLCLLDLGLPDQDGLELLQQWRQDEIHLPVLVLTARHQTRQCVEALNLGADDYLTKPFELDELIARIRALARRNRGFSSNLLQLGDLLLLLLSQTDHDAAQAATDSETTEVTPVLKQVMEELSPVYPHLNSVLQVDWESLQTLQLPPLSLQTILKNLLENALLHAQGLSRIEIVMHDQQLLVQDDGQGLTAAELTQMTRRFWRKSAQQQGHGLGLALVKALLQHHHYQMDLSLNPPQGLSIRIRPE